MTKSISCIRITRPSSLQQCRMTTRAPHRESRHSRRASGGDRVPPTYPRCASPILLKHESFGSSTSYCRSRRSLFCKAVTRLSSASLAKMFLERKRLSHCSNHFTSITSSSQRQTTLLHSDNSFISQKHPKFFIMSPTPYTMTVEIKNDTDHYIAFVGSSTLSSIWGTTEVKTEGDIQNVKISKSGSTSGLFTALSFVAAAGSDSSKNVPFSVWATMGASAGSTVEVKLVDATPIINGDLNQLRAIDWADKIYENTAWQQDNVDRAKFKPRED
ncbi:uncharacterized protein K489DRAFT_271900 [Dissoconium aciculare CBS 342.82]|uniref:Uncharacterized protein n=1 Tax=Dissoconium aciculare CBS 342.82 TaxID=1314786 RepID=A0A6J3LZZ2_9PEZI|nr:uncharacterized protein K489DRAFT_271900 [Dissoconium aciculare CBS 342.82]KAF1821326.1 hypothetical protein K489DRAFT_271900 [Dissoconium aciculare CBS 342.82]